MDTFGGFGGLECFGDGILIPCLFSRSWSVYLGFGFSDTGGSGGCCGFGRFEGFEGGYLGSGAESNRSP